MTRERNAVGGTVEVPTASEYIPQSEAPAGHEDEYPMLRYLQATGGKGVEVVAHEPYDEHVDEHTYVCDQCGEAFDTEDAIGHHLHFEHDDANSIGTFEAPTGETVTVPATFRRPHVGAHDTRTASLPAQWSPDRVYRVDDTLRCETHLGDGVWIEVIYYTEEVDRVAEEPAANGWHAITVKESLPSEGLTEGETLWTVGD